MRYKGKVRSVHVDGRWGFVGIQSVTMADGSPHDLQTTGDLFFHSVSFEGNLPLREGVEVWFGGVDDDPKRGEGFFRINYATETDASRLKTLSEGGLTLNVQGPSGGRNLEHSSVFMSWCISSELADKIKKRVQERQAPPHLLVIYWPESGRLAGEQRLLIGLTEPMAYLTFRYPGVHRVIALVVFGRRGGDCQTFISPKDAAVTRPMSFHPTGTRLF